MTFRRKRNDTCTNGVIQTWNASQVFPNSEVPTMSTKRERPVWNRQNVPLMLLGVGILLVLVAAGTVVWVVYAAPVIARLTGT